MPINNRLQEAYGEKRKNSLSPYMQTSPTGKTSGMTMRQPVQANESLFHANNIPAASQPGTVQSAVSKAYSQSTAPSIPVTTPSATASVQPGAALRNATQKSNTPSVSGGEAQNTALLSAYGSSQNGAYSAQRQNAIDQATSNYNKLLNYLPEYLDIMGMRGLGVSEQAYLNAAKDYQQGVADINASYDELERAYRDQQISNINTLSGELSAYIAEAGDAFSTEGYDRFKQGLLQAGYTEQEIAAAENLLSLNNQNQINSTKNMEALKAINPAVTGQGISAATATETDFGSYYDTGKKGTGQYQLVQDILTAARSGRISNGSIVDFNYGNHAEEKFFVYYNGYFYPIDAATVNPNTDVIIGRGRNNQRNEIEKQLALLPKEGSAEFIRLEDYEQDEVLAQRRNLENHLRALGGNYKGYIDPDDLGQPQHPQ